MTDTAIEKFKQENPEALPNAKGVLQYLATIKVTNAEDARLVADQRVATNERYKYFEKRRKEITGVQYAAYKAQNAFFDEFTKPLKEAVRLLDKAMNDWREKQAEQLRAAQAEAEAAARRMLAAQHTASDMATVKESQAQVEHAMQVFRDARAEKTQIADVGLQERDVWRAVVVDEVAFLKAAVENKQLRQFVTINDSALTKVARGVKVEGMAEGYPGIRFEKARGFAS